jgi:hypothetical protein
MGIMLEPIRWETHAHPAAGDSPQGIINRQIVDNADIVIGVFWSRLGTPTPAAASGTVEEIERLRARDKPVLLYFSLADLPQDHDRDQFAALQEYKGTLRKDTLYREFETTEELDRLFFGHLTTVVHEIGSKLKLVPQSTSTRSSNLVMLRPLTVPRMVIRDDSDTWRYVKVDEAGFPAAIAIFRNEPIKDLPLRTIEGLTAQINFYEAGGGEAQRVNYGTWLRDPFNFTSLAVSDTRELIIAVDHPGAPSPLAIENTRHRAVDYEQEGSQAISLVRQIYDVNVRLIGKAVVQGDVFEDFHLNVDLRGETPAMKFGWIK